jgi:predicted nucleic-acid-binding Zn-ribbon protein
MANLIKCPKCGAPLEASGEIASGGKRLTVYQCEQCVVPWTFHGQTFQAALTFALDEDGNAFDTETFKPIRFGNNPCDN